MIVLSAGIALASAAGALAITSRDIDLPQLGQQASDRVAATLMSLGFGIDQVSVTGQRHAADSDVFDALDLGNVRAFWQLDAAAALKRIERISWVDEAQIRRVYSSTLEVLLTERAPAAVWRRGEKLLLVDLTGRVLGPIRDKDTWRLPEVQGEGAPSEVALLLTALSRHPVLAKHVAHSERIAERRWRIVMANGSRIELAAEREVEGLDQIASARALQTALSAEARIIDVRTPGRLATRPLTQTAANPGRQASVASSSQVKP